MNKNYMNEIAEMLGVSLNESFQIDGCINPYTLTEDGLIDCCGELDNQMLALLLADKVGVVNKPWKPKDGEKYFFISIQNDKFSIGELTWNGDSYDYELYHMGNFFKSKKEALKNTNAYKEFIMSSTPHKNWRVE